MLGFSADKTTEAIVIKTHNPAGIAGPFGHYDQGVEAADIARLLHVSGQVGVAPDGSISDDIEAQIEQTWRNVEAVLAEAGMTTANIVRTVTYILDADPVPLLAAARRRHLGPDCKAASTTFIVAGLIRPEWKVEIDAVAVA